MTETSRYEDFDRLLARNRRLIERACWYFADGNTFLYQELVQQVRVALWDRRLSLRKGSNRHMEKAWVLWQCRSVHSHHQRRKKPDTIPFDEEFFLPEEEDNSRELIEEMAVELTPKERRLLDLLLEGYKPREIARMMDLTPADVSRRRYRMIEKMRQTHEKQNRHDTRTD